MTITHPNCPSTWQKPTRSLHDLLARKQAGKDVSESFEKRPEEEGAAEQAGGWDMFEMWAWSKRG
ncbi:hypothetical protein Pyn_32907 [Prunus yedoensis var. nudiflora]|uniref:Uncharacterized protein n=1 Tax=Prunus yedoensis var. nudiflora TaxID=2094558 RepID=A0A314Z3X6_PRUYE|nr:hypothetical protein Pyn_32907 [Prunus yedoensis var. nudiflora]